MYKNYLRKVQIFSSFTSRVGSSYQGKNQSPFSQVFTCFNDKTELNNISHNYAKTSTGVLTHIDVI